MNRQGLDYPGVTVVYFCHDGQGHFLLNKRSLNCRDEHSTWDPGGGGIDFGDGVEATIRKEVKEEYSSDVLDFEFLGFRDIHRTHEGQPTHWIALDFKVLVDRAKVKNGEPHKFDDLQWFTLTTLPSPLHSQFPGFIEKYGSHLG